MPLTALRTALCFLCLVAVASAEPMYLLEGSGEGVSRFETTTGVEVFIGNTGMSRLQGAAFRPSDNTLFAIHTFGNNGLYTINTTTGAATLVGDTNIGGSPESLAFTSNGTLYTATTSGTNLYTIDSNTGAATLLGSISGMSDVDGLTVSPVAVNVSGQGVVPADTLFAVDSGSLYIVDPNTLVATLIGSIDATETIAFDSTGVLYGVNNSSMVNRIDLSTLTSTTVGGSSFPTVWGSAFANAASVPEPESVAVWVLLLLCVVCVGARTRCVVCREW
jgi:Strictosidine synthase-like, N-terminal